MIKQVFILCNSVGEQIKNDLATFRSFSGSYSLESIWQHFCSNPPKGFEKYYKSGGAAGKKKESEDGEKKESEDGKSSENQKPEVSDPPPSRSSSEPKPKSASSNDWNFGMFGQTASNKGGGGSGRPIGGEGGSDKEKWLLIGALGVVSLIGGLAFMEMGYKEIAWKEFVNRFVDPTYM